jgi:methylenetetrahydrofolate dehydrogenase(NAD+)/5,10-methenyltetrahydrofolate cyclohydrolase
LRFYVCFGRNYLAKCHLFHRFPRQFAEESKKSPFEMMLSSTASAAASKLLLPIFKNSNTRGLATLIKGQDAAKKIMSQVSKDLAKLQAVGIKPKLVPVVIGDVAESRIYLKHKKAAALKAGLDFEEKVIPENVDNATMLQILENLNNDPTVHGIIVQLPIPKHLDEQLICNSVAAAKDVDGFTSQNLGKLVQGVGIGGAFVPCTPLAVLKILQTCIPDQNFMGKNAVVAGRSHNVGLPIAMILQADHIKGGLDLTTTICHRYTPNAELRKAVEKADVVVSAAGLPGLIKPDYVKPGAIVIDVGINRVKDPVTGKAKIVGDVDPDVAQIAGFLTPVPGGVGPCTVACLIYNTVIAATRQNQ